MVGKADSFSLTILVQTAYSKSLILRGAWEAQSVKRLTLDFGSGHDLMVCKFEPHIRLYTDSMQSAWDSLSLSLSVSPLLMLSKINFKTNKILIFCLNVIDSA